MSDLLDKNSLGQITNCRVCGTPDPKLFFDLGEQPLANSLLASPNEKELFYPLALYFCDNCRLVQLGYTVDPKILFTNYVWVTGTAKTTQEYSKKFRDEFLKRAPNDINYVLEIASNDGTFLKPFQDNGLKVLGIDPAENISKIANENGVPTEVAFWGQSAADELLKRNGASDAVFARNVLPHVANTRDFMMGLSTILSDKGTLVIELHHAKAILEDLHYDSIYHEHLCYFTLKSLEKLLNDSGLFVYDLLESPINAGNIVVFAKKTKSEASSSLKALRDLEERDLTNEFSSWKKFADLSFEHRDHLLQILNSLKEEGSLIGWGASARSSTLLNFAKIGPDLLPIIIDLNPLKQGKYTAGTHIPISGEEAMNQNPKNIFILAWNFSSEIMNSLKNKFGFQGKCIVPLPKDPRIIEI